MVPAACSARTSTPAGAGSAAWPRAREGPRPHVGGHPGRHVAAAAHALGLRGPEAAALVTE
jgi:hypothetical protein